MRKKSIKILADTWIQIREIQTQMSETNEQNVSFDEIIQNAIQKYSEFTFKKPEKKISTKKLGKPSLTQISTNIPAKLNIPPTPQRKPVKLNVSKEQLKDLATRETDKIKYILIECQMCGSKPITMPVPKDKVLNSDQPVVDISYVHGNPEHVIVAQLDHDFQVRRRRASWVLFESDFKLK